MNLLITIRDADPAEVAALIAQGHLFKLTAEEQPSSYAEWVVTDLVVIPSEGPGGQVSGIFNQAFDQDAGQ